MERYRVENVIGQGKFGSALLCARVTDNKACVVKQVDISKLSTKDRLRADREATVLAKLSHPNIVGFWESFFLSSSNDTLCIVMDHADGSDLKSVLERRKGRLLGEDIVLDWFVQTTLALKHIHDRKILHRDLKTQNIFITSSRTVKVGDFGISEVLKTSLNLAHSAVGAPYYMSPEICQEKRYNDKSDIWSLGCVLYEMVSLRHPFEGRDIPSLIVKICGHEPKPISARYGAVTRALLLQLLKKEARARPSTDVILRKRGIQDRIRRFLSEEQIQQELGEGTSTSAPGLPRTPSARDLTSRLTPKANAVGHERSQPAEAARRQNLRSGIDGLAVGERLGAGAGAACDEAINRVRTNGGAGGDARNGGRRGKQSTITTKASAQQASNARRGQVLSNVTRAAPGIRVESPRKSPSPHGGEDAARGKGAPSGRKLSRAKPVASPRPEIKAEDAPNTSGRTREGSRERRGDSSSPAVKPIQSPSNGPLPSSMLGGTPQPSPSQAVEKPTSVASRDPRGNDDTGVGGPRGGKASAAVSDAGALSPPLISREVKTVLTSVQQRGRGRVSKGPFGISKPPRRGKVGVVEAEDGKEGKEGKEGSSVEAVKRGSATRQHDLRALMAKGRQERRRANATVGEDAEDCVWMLPSAAHNREAKGMSSEVSREALIEGRQLRGDLGHVSETPSCSGFSKLATKEIISLHPPRMEKFGDDYLEGPFDGNLENCAGPVSDKFDYMRARLKRTPRRGKVGEVEAEDGKEGKEGKEGPSVEAVKRVTATRQHDLRALMAKGRQERRRANATVGEDAEDCVWVSPLGSILGNVDLNLV